MKIAASAGCGLAKLRLASRLKFAAYQSMQCHICSKYRGLAVLMYSNILCYLLISCI